MLAMITILLFQSIMLGIDINGTELLNLLIKKDQISSTTGYKISFIVATQDNQFNDPNQGMHFIDCNATWTTEGYFVMKKTNHYEHQPVFAPPGSRGYKFYDYYDDNLIVWRTIEEYVLSSPERNDTLEKVKVFFVDPNNRIVQTGDNIMLHRWPINNPYSTYQFKYYQFPMGRGFSRHLGSVKSEKSLSSGLLKVTSQGSHGPGLNGTWELTIDPNSDYLVREAIFTMEGELKPTKVITSSGVIENDGIRLAKCGTYKSSSGFELSIKMTDISKVVGPNKLYEEVLSCLNSPLPPGTSIIDHRGEKTFITTVEQMK
jgi:hypothetical protein